MKLGVFTFYILLASLCQAQSITVEEVMNNADEFLNEIKNISYQMNNDIKYLMNDDTSSYIYTITQERKPQDSVGFFIEAIHFPSLIKIIYDGSNIYRIRQKEKKVTVFEKELLGIERVKNYINTPYDIFEYNFFTSKLKDSLLLDYSLNTAIFEDIECYVVTLNYDDYEEYHSKKNKYYFTKNEFFPVGADLSVMMYDYIEHNSYTLTISLSMIQYQAITSMREKKYQKITVSMIIKQNLVSQTLL